MWFLAMVSSEKHHCLAFLSIVFTNWRLSCDSTKRRKEFLVLTCGQRAITSMPNGKDDDGESCSDDDSEDEENQTVSTFMNSIQGSIDLCFI